MRLDKYICKSTNLNKTEALEQIYAGNVVVNNVVSGRGEIDEATQVHENNTILLKNKKLELRPFRYILAHKPAGTICSNRDGDYPSLFSRLVNSVKIPKIEELHIAGRLDVDTTGLVLITDDGRWTYNITRPDKRCEKVYRVGLSYGISEQKVEGLITQFSQGLKLQGEQGLTLPAVLEILPNEEKEESKNVLLTITEGKYHQVKRMFAAVGNRVRTLHREKIGRIKLDVAEGQWRYLTEDEVNSFTYEILVR